MKINGVSFTAEADIREGIVQTFKSLLSRLPWQWHPSVMDMRFIVLHCQDAGKLEEPFREEELFIALSELNGDKALGPDDFSLAFWQHR